MMKTIKNIIFDFDGTIADTTEEIINILNGIADKYGFKKIIELDWVSFKSQTTLVSFQSIGIKLIQIPFIVRTIRHELKGNIRKVNFVSGMKDVLLKLHQRDFLMGILTSNLKENIEIFLENQNQEVFDVIFSGSSLFGKDKVMHRLLKQYKLLPNETIYIGDETRDIAAAQKCGIKICAVSWGFNSQKILTEFKPDYFIDKPEELLTIV